MYLNPFKSPKMSNPADAGMNYLNQIPGTISPYYNPYINAGKESLGSLMNQFNELVSNPGSSMNKMGLGFQQSPGYQFALDQGTNAAKMAAAAGGMAGSPMHQNEAASIATNFANQDYYNWLGEVLKMYFSGLTGQKDLTNLGYGASNELANSLGANLMNQANMAYQGTANMNQMKADNYNRDMGMLGAIGSGLSSLFG